jgi:hypothetical protein
MRGENHQKPRFLSKKGQKSAKKAVFLLFFLNCLNGF